MILSNEIVELRAPEPSDLDLLFILENEQARAESSFTTAPASRNQIWKYIDSYDTDIYSTRELRLIIIDKADGKAVGVIDLSDYEPRDHRAFVGISILEPMRGRGFGRAALSLLCNYAAETLGMHQLSAQIAVDNAASRRLFESCGFKTCGRMRSWLRRGPHYIDAFLCQRLFV